MAKALTAKTVENEKPHPKRKEIPDGGCRGLYLVVQPSGVKSYAVRYRFDGKTRKHTLGFPGLAEARRLATSALADVARGVDPSSEQRRSSEALARAKANRDRDTFAALSKQFLDLHGRNVREATWAQYRHALALAGSAWAGRTVHEIRRRDAVDLLDGIAADTPVMANRTQAALSKFFAWCVSRDVMEVSPMTGVRRPAEEHARDRVLSADELRRLWLACDHISPRIAALAKVLVLTGQRRSEVGGIRWDEISGDLWTIPSSRVKNRRTHTVPLSTQVMRIIDAQDGIGEGIFTDSKRGQFGAGLAREKRKLDDLMQLKKPWVWHDLRRVFVTGLGELGFDRDLIELCVNHVSGSRGSVAGIYNRSERMADRRVAFQRWADHVDHVVSGEGAKVVSLGRRS